MKISRSLISALSMAVIAGATVLAGTTDASAKVRWKMAWAYTSALTGHGDSEKDIPMRIETLSGGEFELKGYEPGALVPAMEIFDAVSAGSIDSSYSPLGFWPGKEPSFALFNAYPFGPDAIEYNAWYKHGGGNELLDEVAKKHNLKILICGTHSPEASGWFRQEITSLDQFKGMKMRIFGLGGKTLEKLGVNSQLTAAGDIYAALERGVIDSAEFSMPMMDWDYKFHEIAKHYYFPGWHQPYSTVQVLINRPKWDALEPRWKMLWETVCDFETMRFITQGEAGNAAAIEKFKAYGTQIHKWPPEILAAFEKSWNEVAAEYYKSDATFAKVWDSLNAFRAKYATWKQLAMP